LPEAVLLGTGAEALATGGAELLGAGAELVAAGLAGAGAELDADDALTAGELGAVAEVCFELEHPAKANAVTTTGSHKRRCIFTACSLTGSIENPGTETSSSPPDHRRPDGVDHTCDVSAMRR
jgi:hypothetical protein